MSFSKGACQQKKEKAPAASLKRSNNGLGLPIHIKKAPILLNIRYYILNIRYYLYILPIYITYIYHLLYNIGIEVDGSSTSHQGMAHVQPSVLLAFRASCWYSR